MPTFRGRPCCDCLATWLPVYERELLDRGLIKVQLDVYQLIGGAAASAGTHATGGAFDIGQYSTEALRVARQMGAMTWARGLPAFSTPHAHGVLKGCPHAAASAQRQVVEGEAGGDGLVGSAPDDGPRVGILWPLRTYSEGIRWAKRLQRRRVLTTKIRAQRAALVRGRRRLARLIKRREALR